MDLSNTECETQPQPTPNCTAIPDELLKTTDSSKVCTTACKHDGKTTGAARTAGHVSCSLCCHIYHKDCFDMFIDSPTFWTCPSCKNIAADVRSLHVKLDSVIAQNLNLMKIIGQQQTMLNSLMSLETKVAAVSSHIIPDNDETDDEETEDAEPDGDLLIGDSLIRDVTPTQDSLSVDSTGGATLNIIRKKLKAINPRKRKYQRVFIVAGTNDTSSKRPADKIAEDCKSTIQAAKKVAQQVFMSSIPPRKDNRTDTNKMNNVNQLFLTAANEEDSTFINNDDNFHFRDNSVDTTLLLPDHLHLSATGVKKLLSNLGLSDKAKPRLHNRPSTGASWKNTVSPSVVPPLMSLSPSVTPDPSPSANTPSPIYFRGAGSPLSNFHPTSLSIWNMNFPSSEHAYQYRKCIALYNNAAASSILRSDTPLKAKNIGDQAGTNNRWEDTKQGIMYEILRSKSRQCPRFLKALTDSPNSTLIEDTPNSYWGRGRNGEGLNMLGRLLMTLRSELATQPRHFTPRPDVTPPRNLHGHTQPQSRQQQLRCFNCGEASHTKASCRNSAPLRCYSCRGLGHKQKFCQQH